MRKLKIENLERCMNCLGFVACKEEKKEDVVDCTRFREEPIERQKVAANLVEFSKLGGSTVRNCSF